MISLYKWFNKQSLRAKLLMSYYIILLVFVLPIFATLISYEYQTLKQNVYNEAQAYAAIIADSTAAAVAFDDEKAAYEALSTLADAKQVLAAAVVGQNQQIFTQYLKNTELLSQAELRLSNPSFSKDSFVVSKPITLKNNHVGTLVIKMSTADLKQRFTLFTMVMLGCALVSLLLASWLASYLATQIAKPLKHLIKFTEHVVQDEDYQTDLEQPDTAVDDEIGKLSLSFGAMMSHIKDRDIHFKNLAFHDAITGLHNRHSFELQIDEALKKANKHNTHCGLLFVDLDDFKLVNDNLGHDIGDLLLKKVADKFRQVIRQNEYVFRLGGDEFAIILQNLRDNTHADNLAQRLISELAIPIQIDQHQVSIGASVGIAVYPDDADNKTLLVSNADKAMYTAKSQGKNRYQRYQGK